jgi:peptide/nickel transport system permease protein
MRAYIIRRLVLAVPTLVGVSLIVFFMLRLLPGDVVQQIAGDNQLQTSDRQRIERSLGLDKPAYEQYFRWIGGVFRLDFGNSLRDQSSISGHLARTLPTTVEMATLAIVISLLLAIPVGIITAIRQDSMADYVGRSVSIGFLAIPQFWLGTMIIVYASLWFTKATPVPAEYRQIWQDPGANLKFLLYPFGDFVPVGPAVVLGLGLAGTVTRLVRTQMLEVLRQDYVRTAAAKGLRERTIIARHALKNALIPVITLVGLQVPILVGGSVVIESIYNVPGIGQWFYQAIGFRDYTAVQAIALISAVAVVAANLVVDIAYAYLDPRIRYS